MLRNFEPKHWPGQITESSPLTPLPTNPSSTSDTDVKQQLLDDTNLNDNKEWKVSETCFVISFSEDCKAPKDPFDF
jgi:hypothetical protein